MKKSLLALALIAAGSAQAATITLNDSFGLMTTNWTNALNNVAQFDSSLGTLNSVTLSLSGEILQSLKAENTGTTADNLIPVAGANFLFRQGTTTLQTLSLSNTGSTFAATAFDGTSDYAGTSGVDFGVLSANGNLIFSAANLLPFIGTGNLAAFNIRAVGGGSIESDNGNLDASISTQAKYDLVVTYDYTATPPPKCPSPPPWPWSALA
jgi:hypothetical protein